MRRIQTSLTFMPNIQRATTHIIKHNVSTKYGKPLKNLQIYYKSKDIFLNYGHLIHVEPDKVYFEYLSAGIELSSSYYS